MDTWGFLIILAGAVLYFATRTKSRGWANFSLFAMGVGTGIVIGAVWAVTIFNRAVNNIFP